MVETNTKFKLSSLLFSQQPDKYSLQLFRYLLVGGISALIDWIMFGFMVVYLDVYYLYAAFISFLVATGFNYVLSSRWVFSRGARFKDKIEIGLVFFVSAIGLMFNSICLIVLIEYFAIHFILAKVIASFIVFTWNFMIRKHYVFKPKAQKINVYKN